MIATCIVGATGRMGSEIISLISQTPDIELVCAISQTEGVILDNTSCITMNFANGLKGNFGHANVIIDFSLPSDLSLTLVKHINQTGQKLVSGVTGLSEDTFQAMKNTTSSIIWSSNMSIGVNLLFAIANEVASKIGRESQMHISETHHTAKLDAPSGTALSIEKHITNGLIQKHGEDLNIITHLPTQPDDLNILNKTSKGEICHSYSRKDNVIGEHQLNFNMDNESLFIGHKSESREIYAQGTISAVKWIYETRKAGLYSMKDVLN